MGGYLLGYDVGSSSIKATLLSIDNGKAVTSATSPDRELEIQAPRPGWAEQNPEVWWEHLLKATEKIASSGVKLADVEAIGISYQMHGLVCLDRAGVILRPAIIWCDSRAVEIGDKAFADLGPDRCLEKLLNSPGNFTASKLAWVRENEPEIFASIDRILLPGDYIAYRLTGTLNTTPSGLSEGILWNFAEGRLADFLLEYYGIAEKMIPPLVANFAVQGEVSAEAATQLGLKAGTPVSYRGGDQPNNALSLNVLQPGEVAATAGTSGVVYGVGDTPGYDSASRVNTFVHVNHEQGSPRYGTLLCINGTGILNSWLKHNLMTQQGTAPATGGAERGVRASGERASGVSYEQMNALAASIPVGADGLVVLPYGNGAERTLENRNIGASIRGLDLNRHGQAHLLRAAQEGIVFALKYGLQIMEGMGLRIDRVRAGAANMFLSPLFAEAFATISGAAVELYDTDGSQGAARGAGIGVGIYDLEGAFSGLKQVRVVEANADLADPYEEAYQRWLKELQRILSG
ncbi:MAG: carbohydrate kinase [Spirochaetaceae bacterium]|nr:MAG: carbohydrate kinase [Spirochaetaceae bacterium]